jgi:hypothetical protein
MLTTETPQVPQCEQITVAGKDLMHRVSELIHEGNVRRVTIKQHGETIVEFPLTVGVIGVALAPALAAVGAAAAMLTDCSIDVERIASSTPVDVGEAGAAA